MKSKNFNLKTSPQIWIGGLILLIVIIGGVALWSQGQRENLEHAQTLYQQGDIEGAAAAYKELLDKFGGDAQTWNSYGNALRDLQKRLDAEAAYRQAIKIDPRFETAYRNLTFVSIDLERRDNQAGKIDAAIATVQAGFSSGGSQSIALAEDLMVLYGSKGDTAKATEWRTIRDQLTDTP